MKNKNKVKSFLQNVVGFKNYLFIFSIYKINKALKGDYEKEFSYFLKLLPKKGIVLDIGANIGITAIPLAKTSQDIEIHAYEPILENFQTLESIIKFYRLNNIKTYHFALGNHSTTLKMIMPVRGNAKQQGLSKIYDENSSEKGIIYEVPCYRTDDLYSEDSQLVVGIKMDVENYEYEVLCGATEMLKQHTPTIYCELWDNPKRKLVFELLSDIGYGIYVYDEKKEKLSKTDKSYSGSASNFFFIYGMRLVLH